MKSILSFVFYVLELSLSFKGALDKYNIYLFTYTSIENSKLNQYRNFQLIPADAFSFYEVFCEQYHLPECPIGYCIVYLLKSTLKNRKCYKYSYFF